MSPGDRLNPPRGFHSVLLALFFASGFVALLYQVIWQRLLALSTGLDLYAVTLIVAVFMLGMGLGSFAGGILADRLPAPRLLLVFALAESIVALFALVSKVLYHDLLYRHVAALPVHPLPLLAAAASTLLVPTFCMGVTLPVLSKALSQSLGVAASRIAGLYGWNTLGAAMGAWVGTAVLIRSFGYESSLWIGAFVNLACAFATLLLLRTPGTPQHSPRDTPVAHDASTERPGWSWRLWLAIYFLSGFIALGLEMVWFRLLGVVLKSTAFTFPLLLGTYLAGVGGGSLIGRSIAHRTRHPVRWFLLAQAGVPLYAGLSVGLLLWALPTLASLEKVRAYLGSYEPIEFAFNFFELSAPQAALYLIVPAAMILPATVLMGMSFSFIQRALQSDLVGLGRRVGALQTANILGSTVGVVLVGLVLIDRLGTASTLRILTAGSVVFLALASASVFAKATRQVRWAGHVVGVAMAVLSVLVIPSSAAFWGTLHAVPEGRIIHVDDGTGLAVLTSPDATFPPRRRVRQRARAEQRSIHRRARVSWPGAGHAASGAQDGRDHRLGIRRHCVRSGRPSGNRSARLRGDRRGTNSDAALALSAHRVSRTRRPSAGPADPFRGRRRAPIRHAEPRTFRCDRSGRAEAKQRVLGQSLLPRVLRPAAKPAHAWRFGRDVGADITDSAHVYGRFPARRGHPADVDRQQPADRHRR